MVSFLVSALLLCTYSWVFPPDSRGSGPADSLFCRLGPLCRQDEDGPRGAAAPTPTRSPTRAEAWDGPENGWGLQPSYGGSRATGIHTGRSRDPASGNAGSSQTTNQFLGEMLPFLARKFNSRGGALPHTRTEHSDGTSEGTLARGWEAAPLRSGCEQVHVLLAAS